MSELADLYRLFNDDNVLLYVGVSKSTIRRLAEHNSTTWWLDVASMTVEHFTDRAAALAAESVAVKTEAPLHNVRLTAKWDSRLLTPRDEADSEPIFLTVAETAERLRISNDTVYDLISEGLLPCATFGRTKRVPAIAIDQVVAQAMTGFDPSRVVERLAS